MSETITNIKPPTLQYVDEAGHDVYVKVDLVEARTLVDKYRNREIMYHRTSWSETIDGEYTTLFSIPLGIKARHD